MSVASQWRLVSATGTSLWSLPSGPAAPGPLRRVSARTIPNSGTRVALAAGPSYPRAMKRLPPLPKSPMPKASAAGTERLAAWCRGNGGPELTPDQAKELLERAVRLFYLAFQAAGKDEPAAGTQVGIEAKRAEALPPAPLPGQRG